MPQSNLPHSNARDAIRFATMDQRGLLSNWTTKDYAFWCFIIFLFLITLGSILRIANPEAFERMENARKLEAVQREKEEALSKAALEEKRQKVRDAFMQVAHALEQGEEAFKVSYSASQKCVEIARAASIDAGSNDERAMQLMFVRIQQQCAEWSSLNWNAGRP